MSELKWAKSSYSDSSGGECVEVAVTQAAVRVRDSKDIGSSALCVARRTWHRFVEALPEAEAELFG